MAARQKARIRGCGFPLVGAQLFLREREGLRLSEEGQKLLPRIEAALSSLDAIGAEIAGLAKLERGNLRIAAVPSLLATILLPILREYTVRFPGVELSVFEGTDNEVEMWVQSGLAHVGFAALPINGVMAEQVAQDEWLALVPAGRFPGKTSIALRELARHKFLMSGDGCERHVQRIFDSAGVEGTRAEEIAEKDGEGGPKRCKGHGRLQLLLGVLK